MTTSVPTSNSPAAGEPAARCLPGLDAVLDAYSNAWANAAAQVGFADSLHGIKRVRECRCVTGAASDADLEALISAAGAVRREIDLSLAHLGAELADRASRVPASESVPRKLGFRSAADMVASRIGAPFSDAKRFEVVGDAVNDRTSLLGDVLPAKAVHVAAALDEGTIGLAAAEEIVKFRARMRARAEESSIALGERDLVEVAPELTLPQLKRAIQHVENHLDQDGLEPKLSRQIRERFLRFRADADGTVHVKGCLDPITAAPIRQAIDHLVTQQLRANSEARPSDAGLPAGSGEGPAFRPVVPPPAFAAVSGSMRGEDRCGELSENGEDSGAGDGREGSAHSAGSEGGGAAEHVGLEIGGVGADGLPGPVSSQDRTAVQLAADALATICKHALGCKADDLPGASTTVLVRMPLSDLRARADVGGAATGDAIGAAGWIAAKCDTRGARESADECVAGGAAECAAGGAGGRAAGAATEPVAPAGNPDRADRDIAGTHLIDATRARLLSAAADLIPAVLGTQGEVLDLGRTARHFSRPQRLALIERDGGCAFCGLPASTTEAHHIRWWERHGGRTDLGNGVLLCTTCHHRIHEGWDVTTVPGSGGGTVWFRGPAHSDVGRQWQIGGRKRFDPVFRRRFPPGSPPEDEWSAHSAPPR